VAYSIGRADIIVNSSTDKSRWRRDPWALAVSPRAAAEIERLRAIHQAAGCAGGEIYAKDCAVCHGTNLQGVSAPALTGPSLGAHISTVPSCARWWFKRCR